MRIATLEVSGFRGFAKRLMFDLDADAVLVIAPNGQGKTSLFDSILWALAGEVPRLGKDDTNLISLYSLSGEMSVKLTLRDTDGSRWVVNRSSTGEQQRLTLEHRGELLEGSAATARLVEILWPPLATSEQVHPNLASVITRCVYLQQDKVRHFIDSESDLDKFNAISDLVGTGRITELHKQLDNARTAWSRATNEVSARADSHKSRIREMQAQLAKLGASGPDRALTESDWRAWWSRIKALKVDSTYIPAFDAPDAPLALDSALRQLQAVRGMNDRARVSVARLAAEVRQHSGETRPETDELEKTLFIAQNELKEAHVRLRQAQDEAAREREAQILRIQSVDDLKLLAQVALRHVRGDHCPVCGQPHDKNHTVELLQRIIRETRGPEASRIEAQVSELAAKVAELERATIPLIDELERVRRAAEDFDARVAEREARLQEFEINPSDGNVLERIEKILSGIDAANLTLADEKQKGEELALQLARSSEGARKIELERELSRAQILQNQFEDELSQRERTSKLAKRMLDALSEASTELVENELKRIGPVLQRIYSKVDPHPSFKMVSFLATFANRHGRLCLPISDPIQDVTSNSPETVLSSSQLNALAVSVFLAFNLALSRLPVDSVVLDDPLQSLDDINLLGLVDLLRRTKDSRQLLVSTHDRRFGDLIARKIRPINESQRTRIIEFQGWGRQGPETVDQRDAKRDPHPLKIAG